MFSRILAAGLAAAAVLTGLPADAATKGRKAPVTVWDAPIGTAPAKAVRRFKTGCGSTIDGSQPATGAALTSSPIRGNFQHGATDINNLITDFAGATAPATPCVGQLWLDQSTPTWPLKKWDGASWLLLGTIDPTAHTWSASLKGSVVASGPVTVSINATTGAATIGLTTGTSGHAIPYLDGSNVWSAAAEFDGVVKVKTDLQFWNGTVFESGTDKFVATSQGSGQPPKYRAITDLIAAGTNVTISYSGGVATINSSGGGGGTTYTAGSGLNISGTVISCVAAGVSTPGCANLPNAPFPFSFSGTLGVSEIVGQHVLDAAYDIPASWTGSVLFLDAPTGSATWTLKYISNPSTGTATDVLTITWTSGNNIGTITLAGGVSVGTSYAAGGIFRLVGDGSVVTPANDGLTSIRFVRH